MEPRIVKLDKMYLAGVVVYGNPKKGLFSKAWDIFLKLNVGIKDVDFGFALDCHN